jgi:peptidyl-prolyl cis-trans isomerase SurA
MIKKLKLFLLIIFFLTTSSFANTGIYIFATVDDEIITNHDVEKESEYLKILNPSLVQLNYDKILDLALNSLIREVVKKKEVTKFANLSKENLLVNEQLKNLFLKLNYNNESEFEQDLLKKNNYSLNQIKQKIKIELVWNELIYKKYYKQVKINEKKLLNRVNNLSEKTQKKFFLSEILFEKKKDQSLETLVGQIKLSINEIGFNNTANIYSISESSKLGGKLGWVSENSLSESILEKLKLIKIEEYTDVIKITNSYLILKIDQIELNEIKIDKQLELKKLIQIETNKQLNQFSRIYFDKSKINYFINEK